MKTSTFSSPQTTTRCSDARGSGGPELQDAYHFSLLAADDENSMGDMGVEYRRGKMKGAPLTQPGRVECLRLAIDAYKRAGFTFSFTFSPKRPHAWLRTFAAELALLVEQAAASVGIDPYTGERPEEHAQMLASIPAAAAVEPPERGVCTNNCRSTEGGTATVHSESCPVVATPAAPVRVETEVTSQLTLGVSTPVLAVTVIRGNCGATVQVPREEAAALAQQLLTFAGPVEPEPLATPVVHLNGSGERLLNEQACDCYRAIMEAHSTLRHNAPHMRDYYPLPDGEAVYQRANEQHLARLRTLEALAAEYEQIGEAVRLSAHPDARPNPRYPLGHGDSRSDY